eukprot:Clim_evm38s198 gene=Clim_evmTU38s198
MVQEDTRPAVSESDKPSGESMSPKAHKSPQNPLSPGATEPSADLESADVGTQSTTMEQKAASEALAAQEAAHAASVTGTTEEPTAEPNAAIKQGNSSTNNADDDMPPPPAPHKEGSMTGGLSSSFGGGSHSLNDLRGSSSSSSSQHHHANEPTIIINKATGGQSPGGGGLSDGSAQSASMPNLWSASSGGTPAAAGDESISQRFRRFRWEWESRGPIMEGREPYTVPNDLREAIRQMGTEGSMRYEWTDVKPVLVELLMQSMAALRNATASDGTDTMGRNEGDNESFASYRNRILRRLNTAPGPPFTIQRIIELALDPWRHYKSCRKYCFGLEKLVMVHSVLDNDFESMFEVSDAESDVASHVSSELGAFAGAPDFKRPRLDHVDDQLVGTAGPMGMATAAVHIPGVGISGLGAPGVLSMGSAGAGDGSNTTGFDGAAASSGSTAGGGKVGVGVKAAAAAAAASAAVQAKIDNTPALVAARWPLPTNLTNNPSPVSSDLAAAAAAAAASNAGVGGAVTGSGSKRSLSGHAKPRSRSQSSPTRTEPTDAKAPSTPGDQAAPSNGPSSMDEDKTPPPSTSTNRRVGTPALHHNSDSSGNAPVHPPTVMKIPAELDSAGAAAAHTEEHGTDGDGSKNDTSNNNDDAMSYDGDRMSAMSTDDNDRKRLAEVETSVPEGADDLKATVTAGDGGDVPVAAENAPATVKTNGNSANADHMDSAL